MLPVYRVIEVAVYALLNFVPCMLLAIYPFRYRMRFKKSVTCFFIIMLSLIQIGIGMCAAFGNKNLVGPLSVASMIIYGVFYFVSVNEPLGKTLFTLLMLANQANFIVTVSKCIEGRLYPEYAMESYRWSFSLVMLCVTAIVWIPMFFCIKKIHMPAVTRKSSGIEWHYLWLIPATFYLVWYYEIYLHSDTTGLEMALEPANSFFLFFINLGAALVYYVVSRLIAEQDHNIELRENNHRLALENLHYSNLRANIDEARRAKHDVRHHILLMKQYLRHGELDELAKYLDEYQESVPDDTLAMFCENNAVNAVLEYFAQRAKSADIKYSVRAVIPQDIGIDECDMSVLFGNLLENAIEAAASDSAECKEIDVNVATDEAQMCVTVDNTYTGTPPSEKNGAILSTKHTGNGIGTASVRGIVEKYNGIVRFETRDGKFCVSAMLEL